MTGPAGSTRTTSRASPRGGAALKIFNRELSKLEALEALMTPRRVFLFSGNMIDRPDRAEPRSPPDNEGIAAAAIAAKLDELGAGPEELGPPPEGAGPYARNNRRLLYAALTRGPKKVRFVCLWNRRAGEGPGGTKHMHDTVLKYSGQVHVLDTNELWPEAAVAAPDRGVSSG